MADNGNDRERHQIREIIGREPTFINSKNHEKFGLITAEIEGIGFQILMRSPEFLIGMFDHLVERRVSMNNPEQASQLVELGRQHISRDAWDSLRQINGQLWALLPSHEAQSEEMRFYTGIV